MDFSFLEHYLRKRFENAEETWTDKAYVYSSKDGSASTFKVELSKKFDYLSIEFERDDELYRQTFRYDENLNCLNVKGWNLAASLVSMVQNLDRVYEWAGKRVDSNNSFGNMKRTQFIIEEFERLESAYGSSEPYLIIEGRGKLAKVPSNIGLVIISDDSDSTISVTDGKNLNLSWKGDTPKLLKLIGWWFNRPQGGEKEVSFEEWQNLPMRGFGLPKAPKIAEKPVSERSIHEKRFVAMGKMTWDVKTDSGPLGDFFVVRDTVLRKIEKGYRSKTFKNCRITPRFEELLTAQGYGVSRFDYGVTISW